LDNFENFGCLKKDLEMQEEAEGDI